MTKKTDVVNDNVKNVIFKETEPLTVNETSIILVDRSTHTGNKPNPKNFAGGEDDGEYKAQLSAYDANGRKSNVLMDFTGVSQTELMELAAESAWITAQKTIRTNLDTYKPDWTAIRVDVKNLLNMPSNRAGKPKTPEQIQSQIQKLLLAYKRMTGEDLEQ